MSNIIPDTELGSIEVEVPHTPPAAAAAAAVTTGSGSAAAPTPASPLRQRGASRSATDRSYGATTEPASAGNGSAQITVQPAPDSARRSSPGKDQAAGSAAPGAMDLLSPEGGGARGGRKSSLGSSPQNRRLSRQNTLQRGKITDGNGTLSPNEFRAGLRSLGFDVSNSSSLARLHRDIDKDQSGIIKESEFLAAFRTLNREAIAAKLHASASPGAGANALPHIPCSIQLVKIGHQKPSAASKLDRSSSNAGSSGSGSEQQQQYGVNFSLEQDIPLASLAARLEEEEAEVRSSAAQSLDSCPPAVRWIDVCGFDPNVLNLLSNIYELPHEMLGEEIELETAPHADFFPGLAPTQGSGASSGGGEIQRPLQMGSRASSTGSNNNAAPQSAATSAAAASAAASAAEAKTDGDESTQTIPAEGGHPTFKLLVHALQLMNYPLLRESNSSSSGLGLGSSSSGGDGGGRVDLVSRQQYTKNKPALQSVPIHIVIANEHTLITCRPWIDPVTASKPASGVYSAAAAAMNRALTAARLASSAELASADEDDPNIMFSDLIDSLSETDATLMGSALGLTSAKQLMLRVVEDVTERNWQLRDQFKEWKVWMGDHAGDVNSAYYQMILRDMEAVVNRILRVLKPLVLTTASLSDAGDDAAPLTHVKPARHNHSTTIAARATTAMSINHLHSSACSDFLTSVNPSLRLLHRDLNRQLEQMQLTAHLIQGLQESFVQRGRDRANDTLYLLTVVTTIVTPLQIFAGVYGMNFDNFPELHYENAYYWFWIINIAVIMLIGLAFRFAKLM